MSAHPTTPAPQLTQALDAIFAHLSDPAGPPPAPAEADPAAFAQPEPPPPVENAADLQAAREWLLREQRRLEEYTRSQLARVRAEHQDLIQQAYLKEQALVFRTQEYNRKEELLQHQAGVLRQQAAALADERQKLAPYLDPLWKGQEELAELRRVSAGLREDVKGQRALLERLRLETASWQQAREAAEADLAVRTAALGREKEFLAARQAEMDRRVTALEAAEAAVRRRDAEWNDLEARLRRDLDEQAERLAGLRRDSGALAQDVKGQRTLLARLRSEAAAIEKARDTAQRELAARAAVLRREREALEARQAQMSQRLADLEKAEAALGRRGAELDELEARFLRAGEPNGPHTPRPSDARLAAANLGG